MLIYKVSRLNLLSQSIWRDLNNWLHRIIWIFNFLRYLTNILLAISLQIARSINNILLTHNFKSFKANANNLRNLGDIHTSSFQVCCN